MATPGNNPNYDLTAANTVATNFFNAGSIPGVDGYVFDLFEADISLTVDPSYAEALTGGAGFGVVDAVASFDLSAESFNNLFFITVDSSDIDDTSVNDVVFSVVSSEFQYPFVKNEIF